MLAAIAFIAVNTVWLRVAHHYAGVAWDAGSLFASFLVQAGLLDPVDPDRPGPDGRRAPARAAHALDAGRRLLALTVLKLFVIDLSNSGGSERIVVFIAVGLLMLVVGWFAPLPPAQRARPGAGNASCRERPHETILVALSLGLACAAAQPGRTRPFFLRLARHAGHRRPVGLVRAALPAEALARLQSRDAADLRVFDSAANRSPSPSRSHRGRQPKHGTNGGLPCPAAVRRTPGTQAPKDGAVPRRRARRRRSL